MALECAAAARDVHQLHLNILVLIFAVDGVSVATVACL
jgi:hypothetical protein